MKANKPDFNKCADEFLRRHAGAVVSSKLAILLEEGYNRGFSDGQNSCSDPDRPCHCKSCGLRFMERQVKCDLDEIPHLAGLLVPGDEVPVGECPKCGALAYLTKKGDYSKIESDWMEEVLASVIAKKYGDGSKECRDYVLEMIYSDDPHTAMAAFMYDKQPVEVSQDERDAARTELFKLIYGVQR